MSGNEAKETLQMMQGLIGLALMKNQMEELASDDNNKPTVLLVNRLRDAVQVACDAIDLMDERLNIESKEDGSQ